MPPACRRCSISSIASSTALGVGLSSSPPIDDDDDDDDNDDDDDDDDDDDEPEEILGEFEVIQIPNPTPRRPRTFETLKNAPTVRLHPAPIAFPLDFTLLIREGEPLDYIADRGYVSILGQICSNPPHVVSNKCLLKNTGQRISQFKIEILDSHMNSWKLEEVNDDRQRAAYFKLDFFCKQIKY